MTGACGGCGRKATLSKGQESSVCDPGPENVAPQLQRATPRFVKEALGMAW